MDHYLLLYGGLAYYFSELSLHGWPGGGGMGTAYWPIEIGHIRLKSFILHIKDPFHQRILRRNVELSQNFMQNLNKLELECRTLCRTFTDNYESNLVVRVHLVDDPQTQ